MIIARSGSNSAVGLAGRGLLYFPAIAETVSQALGACATVLKTYTYWGLALAACAAILAVLWPEEAASPEERQALAEGRTIITYWDRHSGHEHQMRVDLIEEFNRSQDDVYVRAVPIGYNVSMEKLLTSIAGNAPPDVCAMEGNILTQLAAQGCFTPLNEFMASDPYLHEENFFPFLWDAVVYGGDVYGVPATSDTYCLLWSKDAFRRAGLDPGRPPQTMGELADYAAKLTIQDGAGIAQIGFLPWLPWDHSYMWGLSFGGTWIDQERVRMVCADDPHLLRMFEWQLAYAANPRADFNPPYAVDPAKVMNYSQIGGSYISATNPFYMGKVAMIIEGEWQATFIPKYAPDFNWGVAPIPVPDGGRAVAYSPTTVADCVPRGCRNLEATLAFLKWFHTPRPGGGTSPVSDYCHAIHNIPTRPQEARQPRFMDDPKFRVFVDVLMSREVVSSPNTPVTQFMYDEIDRHREMVILRQMTPADALRSIQTIVNGEIERTLAFIEETAP